MRLLAIVVGICFATSAAADDRKPASPTKPPAAKKSEPAKPACKRRFVGKGLERKVVCVFEKDIVVSSDAPKPKVLIVPVGARKIVGRPRVTDPFAGLSRRRPTH